MEDFFHLSWNNHKATLINNICDLRQRELFCDATITCHGNYFAVHRLVLSAFSGYFKEIFEKTPCKHPFIIIKDVHPEDLEILLEFMYKGKVDLSRQRLSSLMKIATDLRIKGLSLSEEKEDQNVHNSSNISMPQSVMSEEIPNAKFLSSFSMPKYGNSFDSQQVYPGSHSTPTKFKSERDWVVAEDSVLEINHEPLLSSREVFLNAESVPDPLSTSPLKELPKGNSKSSSSGEKACNSDDEMIRIKEDQSDEVELNVEFNSLNGDSDNETSSNVNSLFSEDSTASKSDNVEDVSMEMTPSTSQSNTSLSVTDTLKTWADILRLRESQKLVKHINRRKKKATALRKHVHKKTLRSKTLNSSVDKNKENRQERLKVKEVASLNVCAISENPNTPVSSSSSSPKKSDKTNGKMIADYLNQHDIILGNTSESGAPSWVRSGEENALLLELAKRREDACKVLVKKLSDDVFGGILPSAYMAKYNSLTQQLNTASSYPLSQQMVPNCGNKVAIERLQDSDYNRSATLGAASASTSEWLLPSPMKSENGESSIFASVPLTSAEKEKDTNAFKCDYCIFQTSKKSSMVNHLKKHQKNRFKCKYCSYETSHANLLLTHGKIHSGERPYLCEYCPYRAAQRTSLVNHTRTHTGEKPFKCEYCDYRATQKSNLNYHLRLHNDSLNKSF